MYAKLKNRNLIISEKKQDAFSETYQTLPPGIYKTSDIGSLFSTIPAYEPLELESGLINFKSGIFGKILKACRNFLSEETTSKYLQLDITQKMGIVLYGPQGTGKTCTALLAMQELSDLYGAICLDMTTKNLDWIKRIVREIRQYQNSPIVVFVDEVETSFRNEEGNYLTFLDGTEAVKNLIFIGCTNHIEKISDRIIKRRSRIKHTIEVKSLPDLVYREYLTTKLPLMSSDDTNKFVYLGMEAGLTIDEFKHSVIDYFIEGETMEDAIKNVKSYYDINI